MGTMLQALGLPAGELPEKWNIAQPGKVEAVHRRYREAGAVVIETNTFGGSRYKLRGVTEKERWEINRAGAELARAVAGSDALVAGSIGPTGELLAPWGPLSFTAAVEAFAEQAKALAAGGVDFLLVETMSDLQEARAAFFGARQTGLPVAVQLTFDKSGRTVMGTPPAVAAVIFSSLGAAWVGMNCGTGPAEMVAWVNDMAAWTRRISVYPNAGVPQWREGRQVYPLGPEEFASAAEQLVRAGASLVGGCCGTTPDHIGALQQKLQSLLSHSGTGEEIFPLDNCLTSRGQAADMPGEIAVNAAFDSLSSPREKEAPEAGDIWRVSQARQPAAQSSPELRPRTPVLATRTELIVLTNPDRPCSLIQAGSLIEFDALQWQAQATASSQAPGQRAIPLLEVPAQLSLEEVASAVDNLQMSAVPVVFEGDTLELLETAVLHYNGRAGLLIPPDADKASAYLQLARRWGALPVYR